MSAAKKLALLIGLVYAAIAVAGLIGAEASLAGRHPANVFAGFGVSWLLNIIHAGIALAGLAAAFARPAAAARVYGVLLGIVFLGLTAYGMPAAIAGNGGEGLNIGWTNVVLYAVTAAAGVFLAYGKPIRRQAGVPTGRESASP